MSDVDQVSDDDLLNEVLSDEATDSPVVTEQQQEQVEEPETTTEAATTETTAEKPVVDDNAPQVPSWRVREINEEKRRLAEENERLKAERTEWQRSQRPTQQEPEKAAKPDPLLDPEGYAKHLRDEIRNELLAERREESLEKAAQEHPEEFKEAYAAAQQAVDPALRARMQASRDPGKTLLEWHRDNKVKAEVGNDPAAYKARLRDELLKDPEFRKHAQSTWQSQTQHPDGRPRIDLGPSLNGASRANTTLKSSNDDVSDDQLFQELAG